MTKNPINWNRSHQYEGESWDDNPNDEWTKRTQMQKDPPDNHNDKDSTWTEDDAPQHHVTSPHPKYPAKHTQRVQQIQVQPKQQSPALVQKKKGRRDQPPSQDDIDELEIIQERLAALQKEREDLSISDSDSDWQQLIGAMDNNNNLAPRSLRINCKKWIDSPLLWMINTGTNKDEPVNQSQLSVTPTQKPQHRAGIKQRQKKLERELQQLKATQQIQQQENNDLNYRNVVIPDIQGTVGLLTGLYPSSSAQSTSFNARLRLKETGLISTGNVERTDSQINESHEANVKEEEDEQTVEAALIQNKDYRVNIISQPQAQENLGTQPQIDQGLNTMSQMEKNNPGRAPIGVLVKRKQGGGSKKTKIEGLNSSNEPNQCRNAHAQAKTASEVPKPMDKMEQSPDRVGTLQSREIGVEVSLWNREEERADEDGSSGYGGKDW
ncbi:MAG: hypothetical protein EZS28_006081 [Streblomastix strix]|uniref:Uncharacterized protein n=1 Tax=Streblomastix strix TaxID=222440 RepID=A0A5J4WTL6_9EUKA|nr:MAG: hypothetical protein EZS28_006081 [Streblomastix strix]